MSYIQDNLMPREKILYTAKVSPAVFLPAALALVITLLVFAHGLSPAVVVHKPGTPAPPPSAANLFGVTLLCLAGFFLLYTLWLALQAAILMATTEFAVTNRRVIAKRGFVRRHTLEILLSQVESVSVNQNVLGRILNFGTVTITGTGGTSESFRAIVNPIGVRRKVNQIIEAYLQYQQRARQRASL